MFGNFLAKLLNRRRSGGSIPPPQEGSLRDGVTGLYNKIHLRDRLADYMSRVDREKKSFALILWDIKGFVKFNNEFGQKHGDRLLNHVAQTIKKSLRGYDEAFRWPDEFCGILFPGDDHMADIVLNRVNQTVSKDLFEGGSEYAGRGFSLVAGYVLYPSDHRSPEALLHAAAQALHKSKVTGVGA